MNATARRLALIAVPLLLAAPVYAALAQTTPAQTPPAQTAPAQTTPTPTIPATPPATPGAPAAPGGMPAGGPPAGGNPLELKAGPASVQRGQALIGRCQGCHGQGLVSTDPDIPSVAGQIPSYTRLQLAAFRAKLRPSMVMQRVAASLSDQDIVDIAAYAAAQQPGPAWKTTDAAQRAKGMALFMAGDTDRNIIACAICHGANGRGLDANGIASITNLAPGYAVEVLHEFRDAPKFGIPHPDAMRIALKPMTDADLEAVAAYISSMK